MWYHGLSSPSKPVIRMSSAIPNILGIPLKDLSIFFWNMLPTPAIPNGNCMYLYKPNGQKNLVVTVNLILGYDNLKVSMSVKYLTYVSLGSISFNVGPLCIGLISTFLKSDWVPGTTIPCQ